MKFTEEDINSVISAFAWVFRILFIGIGICLMFSKEYDIAICMLLLAIICQNELLRHDKTR